MGDGGGRYGRRDAAVPANAPEARTQAFSRPGMACPPHRVVAGRPEPQARGPLRGAQSSRRRVHRHQRAGDVPAFPTHRTTDAARASLERAFRDPEPLRISRQVIREYLAVVTRPQTWPVGITRDEALDDVSRLTRSFEILEDGPLVTETLVGLCREVPVGGRQIHDANIVATMLARGEHRLLTFNVADFRRYGDRIELVDS